LAEQREQQAGSEKLRIERTASQPGSSQITPDNGTTGLTLFLRGRLWAPEILLGIDTPSTRIAAKDGSKTPGSHFINLWVENSPGMPPSEYLTYE
jgi:hypothetical protein